MKVQSDSLHFHMKNYCYFHQKLHLWQAKKVFVTDRCLRRGSSSGLHAKTGGSQTFLCWPQQLLLDELSWQPRWLWSASFLFDWLWRCRLGILYWASRVVLGLSVPRHRYSRSVLRSKGLVWIATKACLRLRVGSQWRSLWLFGSRFRTFGHHCKGIPKWP